MRARYEPRFRPRIRPTKGMPSWARSNFLKSYEYVNRVKRFKDKDAVTQVRQCVLTLQSYPMPTLAARPATLGRDLERKHLEEFEVAQLGNLLPDSAEEGFERKHLPRSIPLRPFCAAPSMKETQRARRFILRRRFCSTP